MIQPIIVPYQNEDNETICSLLVESFHGKFHSLVNLDDKNIVKLLRETWSNDSNDLAKKQMVIKENGKIIGTILLKWKENNQAKPIPININFMCLLKQFGLTNIFKFIVGTSFLEYQPKQQECYIEHIAISSSYQNKGIGKLLLAWSKSFVCNNPQFKRLTLYVSDKNKNAIHLYEKMGFHIEKSKYNLVRRIFFQEPNWHFMTWSKLEHINKNIRGERDEKKI
ncbi:N-acetyltransferase [Clostridium sp. CF012]|uniref:GNAT family N-acetyltransferase n=1 Tax=Clostridium sp. CF012 TaxID=2843319 RepID=UPI001C0D5C0D|nr:GNAT family N-acetyltransferase [Clostridium sp. CF012]MBU3142888.1 GNAT family N-acetyltransferase [Clostridium sp. CF012]